MKRFFWVLGLTAFITAFTLNVLSPFVEISYLLTAAAIFAAVLVIVSIFLALRKNRQWQRFVAIAFAVVLFSQLFGLSYSRFRAAQLTYENTVQALQLRVYNCEKTPTEQYYIYTAESTDGSLPYKISLISRKKLPCEGYDIISAKVKFSEADEKYFAQNAAENIMLSAFVQGDITVVDTSSFCLSKWFEGIRGFFENIFDNTVSEASPFAKAVVLGNTAYLSGEDTAALKEAGLSHITSVSGLHVSILAAVLSFLFSAIRPRGLGFSLYCAVLLFFAGICGFSPSVIRAVLLLLAAFGFRLLGRHYNSLNNIGLLLCVFLSISPLTIYSASFLLSYAATIGIYMFNPIIMKSVLIFVYNKRGKHPSAFFRFILLLLSVSVSCFITALPAVLYLFGYANLVPLISNVVCLPVMNLAFISLLLTLLFASSYVFIPLASFLGWLSELLVKLFMFLARLFTGNFFNGLTVGVAESLIAAAAGVLTFFIIKLLSRRFSLRGFFYRALPFSVAIFMMFAIALVLPKTAAKSYPLLQNNVACAYADVGQGHGGAVIYGNEAVVFDCGGAAYAGSSMVSLLNGCGVTKVDTVVFSHLHADHTSGFDELCTEYEIKNVYIPFSAESSAEYGDLTLKAQREGALLQPLESDILLQIGEAELYILTQQLVLQPSDENENCLVGVLSYNGFSALFAGDCTKKTESRLIESYGSLLDVDVYAVAHNGSKTSSTEAYVANMTPQLSIISVGAQNSYGHPTEEVVQRLSSYGTVLRTDETGSIVVSSDGEKINVAYG